MLHEFQNDERNFPDYFGAVRKHWRVLFITVIPSIIAAFFYLMVSSPYEYQTIIRLPKNEYSFFIVNREEALIKLEKKIIPDLLSANGNSKEYQNIKVKVDRSFGNEMLVLKLTGGLLDAEKSKVFLSNIASGLIKELRGGDGELVALEARARKYIDAEKMVNLRISEIRSQIKKIDGLMDSAFSRTSFNLDPALVLVTFNNSRQDLLTELDSTNDEMIKMRSDMIKNNGELIEAQNRWDRFVVVEPERYKKNNPLKIYIFFLALGLIAGLLLIGGMEFIFSRKLPRANIRHTTE